MNSPRARALARLAAPAAFVGVASALTLVALSAAADGIEDVLWDELPGAFDVAMGWLSLFMAVTVVGQDALLPMLCITVLPAWLLVTDRRERVIEAPRPAPVLTGGR